MRQDDVVLSKIVDCVLVIFAIGLLNGVIVIHPGWLGEVFGGRQLLWNSHFDDCFDDITVAYLDVRSVEV